MINTIEIKWDLLGAYLASGSDTEQAAFFKGFAKELGSPSFGSHYAREMQMMHTNDKLDKDTKKTLEEYLPALWYKEDAVVL